MKSLKNMTLGKRFLLSSLLLLFLLTSSFIVLKFSPNHYTGYNGWLFKNNSPLGAFEKDVDFEIPNGKGRLKRVEQKDGIKSDPILYDVTTSPDEDDDIQRIMLSDENGKECMLEINKIEKTLKFSYERNSRGFQTFILWKML